MNADLNTDSLTRSRRGSINFRGTSKILFGAATQPQINGIYSTIQVLENFVGKERVLLYVDSLALNMTLRNMHAMWWALQQLSAAVNVSSRVHRLFSIKTIRLEGEQQLFHALMDLLFALGHINTDVLGM